MLKRYRDIEICKKDIEFFIELVQKDIGNAPEVKLKSIAKGVIFFKRVFLYEDSVHCHYSKCLISDSLNLVHSLGIKSRKLYYTTYRSFIENFVRVLLKYDNLNDTGVRNMVTELRDKYGDEGKIFIDYLEGEYGKCCKVIHSNIKADLQLYSYYEELLETDEMRDAIDYINIFETFCNKCKTFVIKQESSLVNNCFYNHKELLSFLIGRKNYTIFESICD